MKPCLHCGEPAKHETAYYCADCYGLLPPNVQRNMDARGPESLKWAIGEAQSHLRRVKPTNRENQ